MSTPFRIAMVGPHPPERSGIAEYTAGLSDLLRDQGLQVDAIAHADLVRLGMNNTVHRLLGADAIVYQMGNHPAFHGWMLPLMAAAPGIVHLHDLVLHHMAAGVLNEEGRLLNGDYFNLLEKWYSGTDIRSAKLALRSGSPVWNREDVVRFPLHQVATKLATEVVVHSRYAADQIGKDFPWLPVTVVPQLYPTVAQHRIRDNLRTIALLGGGHTNRRFDWIVQALSEIDSELNGSITLEIAGQVEAAVLDQLESIADLRNVQLINHGHLDDDQFSKVFERADLMIALRQPTMGEASAVVCKAMQAGLPVIVSDHGWYAELPASVKKVAPDAECPDALAALLRQLTRDPATYAAWAEECSDASRRLALDPYAAAEGYARLLRRHRVVSDFKDCVADAVASLKVDIDSPLAEELHRIDVLSSLRGDRWVNPALAALKDQELDSHARVVGATVGPYPYSEPLPEEAFQGQAAVAEQEVLVAEPSSIISLRVELTNNSEYSWFSPLGHALRPFGIYLGHFWIHAETPTAVAEQPRHFIHDAVAPMSSAVHDLTVRAPAVAGDYYLEIDLVQESVCWFKSRGFSPARLLIRVEAAQ